MKNVFDSMRIGIVAGMVILLTLSIGPVFAQSFTPHTPSQEVACNQVDSALSRIPNGDAVNPVTDEETGPGGWRLSSSGGSFVTFAHTLDTNTDIYSVVAGRSNVGGNAGIINDYPEVLDLPQASLSGALVFSGNHGEIVLTGDTSNDPPLFALPGTGGGQVRINLHDRDRDGVFEGCAVSPLLANFGFTVQEGGDFVQREYFKASATTDANGTVTFFEWTEISTFNNTNNAAN